MTMPDERYRSLIRTRDFLTDLLKNPENIDPTDLPHLAYRCLRHYPWNIHLNDLAKARPDILENPKPITKSSK